MGDWVALARRAAEPCGSSGEIPGDANATRIKPGKGGLRVRVSGLRADQPGSSGGAVIACIIGSHTGGDIGANRCRQKH